MFSSKYLDQINEIQRYQLASIVQSMTASMKTVSEWNSILTSASNGLRGALSENVLEQYQQMMQPISESVQLIRYFHEYEHLITSFQPLDGILSNYNSDDSSNMESTKNEEINNKVITEIFQPDSEKAIDNKESPIITLSPVNDQVLKYLSEHPESFYQLTDNDFEIVMAEIYSKLGYDVTRTKATRDGGKDLIIRIPEILGDFIYYVECKKYNPKRPIGIGIIRSFVGTVNTDRVNGGILATTSFFTRDAYNFISDNKWNCQIKTHDYNVIRNLLTQVVTNT
ncbi:MAG: restriction endonuclease [Lachnospiraceae bacterium]|jgi:hypothetical protein